MSEWKSASDPAAEAVTCPVCFHHCRLMPGKTGVCRGRKNQGGVIVPVNYGLVTSLAMDPIEKKPFARFYPGRKILSVGSFGCNLACPFCQNYEISQAGEGELPCHELSPKALADLALYIPGNLGIAFTYNEPLISWEYIHDTGKILRASAPDKKIAVVTNGTASGSVIRKLIPYMDAMNIDLKGDEEFYRRELHGDFSEVKQTILAVYSKLHLEVTTLVIPGKNDSAEFIRREAMWLASLDPSIPLHLSRYFPRYHSEIPATPKSRILELKAEAEKYLRYVYAGNM